MFRQQNPDWTVSGCVWKPGLLVWNVTRCTCRTFKAIAQKHICESGRWRLEKGPQLQLNQENEIICLLLQIETSVSAKVEHAKRMQNNQLKPGRRSPSWRAGSEWFQVPWQHWGGEGVYNGFTLCDTQSGLLLNLAKQTSRWFLFNEDEILRAGGRRDVFKVRLVFYFCTFSWIRFQFSGSKPQTSVGVVPAVKINCQLRVSTSLTTTHTLFIHYYQCITSVLLHP